MRTAVCTVCSGNYLPNAILGLTSLHECNPDTDLFLLLVERPEIVNTIKLPEFVRIYTPDQIELSSWYDMAFWYNVIEYNTALKPAFFTFLLKQGYDALIFVDPDIKAYHSFSEAFEKLTKNDVLLTPHLLEPVYDDGESPPVEYILAAGVYNLGFLGLRNSERVLEVMNWWNAMLYKKCIHQYGFGYFVDQFWAGAFPAFFEHAEILRSQSYNSAWWNCFQRNYTLREGKWYTDDGPLIFFHFSQIDVEHPEEITRNQSRSKTTKHNALYTLLTEYLEELATYREHYPYESYEYSFNRYTSGELILSQEREFIRNMGELERKEYTDYFQSGENIKRCLTIKKYQSPLKRIARLLRRLLSS